MNHYLEEYCHINNENNDSISQNTRRKNRVVEDAIPPPTNQALTLGATPDVPIISAQPKVANQQMQGTRNKRPNEPLIDPSHVVVPMVSQTKTKPI